MKVRTSRASNLLLLASAISLENVLVTASEEKNWIDPDTPEEAYVTYALKTHTENHDQSIVAPSTASPVPTAMNAPTVPPTESPTYEPTKESDRREYKLVFSDEFNVEGRSLNDGDDPRWTVLDKNDYTNDAMHYYSPDNVEMKDGKLVITTKPEAVSIIGYDDVKRKKTRIKKYFTSGMIQSWNKFCFTGGILEAEVQLPGVEDIGGLWPAFWILGNLARHTYVGSSEHVWPWSSTKCTKKGKTAQRISGCALAHHWDLQPGIGRGAPEIDVFEVQAGKAKARAGSFLHSSVGQPYMSTSFQCAPGVPSNRPGPGGWPYPGQWYDGMTGGNNSELNLAFWGSYNFFLSDTNHAKYDYWADALSYNTQLDKTHFSKPHIYRVEWEVPTNETGGHIHWFMNGELLFAINGTAVQNSTVNQGTEVSSEPSYILFNTAISKNWGFPEKCTPGCPDCKQKDNGCYCKHYNCLSTNYRDLCGFQEGFCDMVKKEPKYTVNWVRVYQDPNRPEQKVGCSTPERPTRRYIEAHKDLYMREDDTKPLKLPIQRGGGPCTAGTSGETAEACGGVFRGKCVLNNRFLFLRSKMVCKCEKGWTGPNCLAHDGKNPIDYDIEDNWSDLGFVGPKMPPTFLIVGLTTMLVLLITSLIMKSRLDNITVPTGP